MHTSFKPSAQKEMKPEGLIQIWGCNRAEMFSDVEWKFWLLCSHMITVLQTFIAPMHLLIKFWNWKSTSLWHMLLNVSKYVRFSLVIQQFSNWKSFQVPSWDPSSSKSSIFFSIAMRNYHSGHSSFSSWCFSPHPNWVPWQENQWASWWGRRK